MMNLLYFHNASVRYKYQTCKWYHIQFRAQFAPWLCAVYASEGVSLVHRVQSLFIIIIIRDALFIDGLRRAYEPTVRPPSGGFDLDM